MDSHKATKHKLSVLGSRDEAATTVRVPGGDWASAQPLGLEKLPSPTATAPSPAQALWKKGWISRVFRGFKIGEEKKKINAKFLWIEDTACWQKPLFTDSSRLKSETLKSGYCGCAVFFFSKQSGTQFCYPVPGPNPAFLSRSDSHWL